MSDLSPDKSNTPRTDALYQKWLDTPGAEGGGIESEDFEAVYEHARQLERANITLANQLAEEIAANVARSSTAHNDDARDASRWRKFNKVAKRHWNYDKGAITFYLPRKGAGFKPLETTLDEDYEPVACVPSATLSSPVRDLLLGLYEARMNGSAEVTNERLKLISDLLGIEAFACAHPYQQCSRWCGVEARCTVAFKQSSDISSAVEKRSPTQNGDSK